MVYCYYNLPGMLLKIFKMKNIKSIVLLILLCCGYCNAQFIKEDWTQASIFIDPTFTDSGYQIGAELTKVMHWGYASIAASRYDDVKTDVGYGDLVGTLGINWYFNKFNGIRYYAGMRGGYIFRKSNKLGKSTYPMVGGVIGADFNLTRRPWDAGFKIGFRLWTDYREDQKNQFYGDSDAYEPGWITNNPLLQENGAIVLIFYW